MTCDRIGYHFFRAAFAVHLRCIDQSHPEIDAQAQSRDLIRVRVLVLAHAPGALTQRRNLFAIGQFDCFHLDSDE